MKNLNLKFRLKENNLLTKAISVVSLIIIFAGLFAFIIFGLRRFNLINLPDFIENFLFGSGTGDYEIKSDDGDIYYFLNENAPVIDSEGFSAEISLENIRGIISEISQPDNLYIESEAKYYISGKAAKIIEMSLWKKEKKYKYLLKSNGVNEELYIYNGETEYIKNYITESEVSRTANKNFNFSNVPHIQDINYYLDLIESGEITRCEITRKSDENIVNIRYFIPELNQRDIIYISLDTGLVLSVRSYVGGELFYSCAATIKEAYFTGGAPENTVLNNGLFKIN